MTEHCPNPFVNHRWKSSLEIIGREDGDVGRVVVVTLSFIDHRKNPGGRIQVDDVIQEFSASDKTILRNMRKLLDSNSNPPSV